MAGTGSSRRFTFEAIGTHWEIDFYEEITESHYQDIVRKINRRIARFDKTYSRFREDSTIMQLARAPGRYELPADAKPLFDFYYKLYKLTGGKVTPLAGDLLVQAGYDAAYSLSPRGELAAVPRWEDVMSYDHPYITTSQKVILDVGAAGKGYIVDIIGSLLEENGISGYLIDAGGDMLHKSTAGHTAKIGLEHPGDPALAIGVIELGNESICGSAGNRRAWAGIHHIMDPVTAAPASGIVATWAVARSAMVADGLATALFFTPADVLQEQFDFEYLLVRPDMIPEYSNGLRVKIFGAEE